MGHAKTSSDYSGVGWPCPKFHVCSGQNHKNSLVAVQSMGPVARFDLHILVLKIITYTELNLLS